MKGLSDLAGMTRIDDVIEAMNEIVQWAKDNNSRLGYFAALYLGVTERIKEGVLRGEFEDNERMEKMDVIFAKRYLEAFYQYQAGKKASECWEAAFRPAEEHGLIVLQHLLLGMNAHITFDLGVAAAEAAPGDLLPSFKNDFDKINDVLASLVDKVDSEMGRITPIFRWVDAFLGNANERFTGFSMTIARTQAWKKAERLAFEEGESKQKVLEVFDEESARQAKLVSDPPGRITKLILAIIGLTEKSSIKGIIEILRDDDLKKA